MTFSDQLRVNPLCICRSQEDQEPGMPLGGWGLKFQDLRSAGRKIPERKLNSRSLTWIYQRGGETLKAGWKDIQVSLTESKEI